MMKLSTREAIIGIVTYRLLKVALRRTLKKKGARMATKKKTAAIIAAISAFIGALFFWRKRKGRSAQTEI
jgi:hypothetical protein